MDLRCPPGLVIAIADANFGRVDNVTCVNGPVLTTDCRSENTMDIVATACNERPWCAIPTTVEEFGDACPGTVKYLEVLFECKPAPPTTVPPTTPTPPTTPAPPTTTPATTRPQPVATDLPGDVSTFSRANTKLATAPSSTLGMTDLPGTTYQPEEATTTLHVPTTPTTKPTTSPTTSPSTVTATTVAMTTRKPTFCMPMVVRGVQWEHAPAGTIDVQPCPPDHSGQAKWACVGYPARWSEDGPDLSDCVSIKIKNITDQLEQGGSVTVISEELAQTVEEEEELYGGDILQVTSILTNSLGNLDEELQNATATEKTEKTKEVTKNYLKVGSALLEDSKQDSWEDLSDDEQVETASTLITSLEESAFLLADTLEDDQTVVEEEDNVVMEVVVRSEEDGSDLVFPDPNQLSGDWRGITDSITLPADSIKERTRDGKTKIVLLAYNNIGQFLGANSSQPKVQPTLIPKKQVARRPCQEEVVREDLGDVVNSRVLSVSINNPWETTPLSKPVNLTFEHKVTGDNLTDPVCSFWKFDNGTNEFRSGEWSGQGCRMVHNNATHTVCSCDHLTNFAIIMNVKGMPIEGGHKFALSFITYFGFIVSIPCLVLAFITFSIFKNLQSDRTTIHKNLCLTLMIVEIIFMAGISQTANKTLCAVIAILLHYFFLSVFAWMCLEGVQLYIMLVQVFESESSRRKYYYPFGYILPLLIVGISAAIDFESYGTPQYCWFCQESNIKWAFYAPVCLIIFVNILFLSMALFIMCKHSTIQTNPKEKTQKEKAIGGYRRLSGPIALLRRSSSVFSKRDAKRTKEVEPLDPPSENTDRLTLGTTRGDYLKSLVRGAVVLLCLLGVTWAFGLLCVMEDLIAFAYLFTLTNAFQGVHIFVFHCCMNDKVRKEYRRYVRNSTWLPDCIREQYGGTILTNSNQQNSFRSSSAAKRPDSKRFSNTTGSYSVENRKLSNSYVYRNSGQYEPVKYNSELSAPEESTDFGTPRVIADEGISMDFEENPVHESTRLDAGESSDLQQNSSNNRLSTTTEFQPLIIDTDCDSQKHAKLINIAPTESHQQPSSPIEMHPLIRESGIGGSRSGSSSSEDFTPASPMSPDKPTKAHLFPNSGTCGLTGSMPDLINPLTAHACKARMDLVPVVPSPTVVPTSGGPLGGGAAQGNYHTLPATSSQVRKSDSPCKAKCSKVKSESDSDPSPWHKRASRMDDVDDASNSTNTSTLALSSTPASPESTRSHLETVI
ncbi:adhesion G protein-coupled receptor L2-like [Diadema antillarum]|uniref:adhesion G protein-coupled receptor L2-like n=1 Tax=Diadema antillarum TaxID=105358 RepID=UPI003A85D459